MSTEYSLTGGDSTEPSRQISGKADSCAFCNGTLERRSHHSATNRQTVLFGCAECPVGTVAIVDLQGPLSERCTRRLERAQRRCTTGINAYRVGAFLTDDLPSGQYTVERVDEHQFTIELPGTATSWDVLRLADSLSVGPLCAERLDGAVSITDTRWSGVDVEDTSDVVTDGGTIPVPVDGEAQLDSGGNQFAVSTADEPRTKRAKTENMRVSLLRKGGRYEVHSASDNYYQVDVLSETCTCPDAAGRCKHLRRVDLEIQAGLVPKPDGQLP